MNKKKRSPKKKPRRTGYEALNELEARVAELEREHRLTLEIRRAAVEFESAIYDAERARQALAEAEQRVAEKRVPYRALLLRDRVRREPTGADGDRPFSDAQTTAIGTTRTDLQTMEFTWTGYPR